MLAEQARVSAEAIGALERGRRKTPQRETLALLLDALEPPDPLRARLKAAAIRPSAASRRDSNARAKHAGDRARNLPRPLTSFLGREKELEALAALSSSRRLVTITGAGGVGKTRTAIELAFRLAGDLDKEAWFIELGPLHDAALLAKAIASALAIPERAETALLDVIVMTLRDQKLLLVLDNCEHLIDAAAQAAHSILTRCPRVTIIAASREPLRTDGEAVYRLAALETPHETIDITPDAALRYSSVALFVERSRARDSTFVLTEHNARFAAEICRRLDGIPLALELAAAKTSLLGLADIATRLNERFALLTNGARTALPRHQTLRALIEWSFDLLSATERELFCRLAVFAGSWNLAAAEAVTADTSIPRVEVIGLVSSLVEKSLVVVDPANPDLLRFRLFETTREYAAAKLLESGKFQDVMRLHASYVLTFAREARSLLRNEADTAWLDMVQLELENIRTALAWSLRDGNAVATGAEITAMIGFFWDSRSHDEGTRWLCASRSLVTTLTPNLAALVLLEYVRVQPSSEETYELAKRSLEIYRELEDEAGVATALEYLGRVLINIGRFDEAVLTLDKGVLIGRQAKDNASLLRMLALVAFAYFYGGDPDSATKRLSDADVLLRPNTRVGDRALILKLHAEIALASGDVGRAVKVAAENLELLQRAGDFRRIGIAQVVLAQSLAAAEQLSDAYIHAAAAVGILSRSQIPLALVEAYIVAASICERLHDDDRAARLMGFALRRAATLRFVPPFTVTGLAARTVEALSDRLGREQFDRLSAHGSEFDERRAFAELDKDSDAGSANMKSGPSLDRPRDAGEAHA